MTPTASKKFVTTNKSVSETSVRSLGLKHAFLIIAHRCDETLSALIELLDDSRNDIYLHMDAKCADFCVEKYASRIEHAGFFAIARRSVVWGAYSQIAVELDLLKAATAHDRYSYYHLISGQDLPIQSQDTLHNFFDGCGGRQFIRIDQTDDDFTYRLDGHFLWNRFGRRKNQSVLRWVDYQVSKLNQVVRGHQFGMAIKKGDNWFSITDELARYVVQKEPWIERVFHNSICGDELFLQTLVWENWPKFKLWRNPGENEADACMRLINWNGGESPQVFTVNDADIILNSRLMFARKFDCEVDDKIVRLVNSKIADDTYA